MTSGQRRIDVDPTSFLHQMPAGSRRIDADPTSFLHQLPAGISIENRYDIISFFFSFFLHYLIRDIRNFSNFIL